MNHPLRAIVLALAALPLAHSGLVAQATTGAANQETKLPAILAGGVPKTVADLRAMEEHTKKLLERILPCTVSCNRGGSGVIVKGGYVLTCAHVTRNVNRDIAIVLQDGTKLKGKSLGLNHRSDAGLVKIEASPEVIAKLPYCEMGRAKDLKIGQWVMALGENGGKKSWRKPPLRIGRLLRVGSSLTTDCTLSGGDSGGPLFDMAGRVIGINSKISGSLESNMHVSIDMYHNEWDKFLAGETMGRSRSSRGGRRRSSPTFDAKDLGATADGKVEGMAKVLEVKKDSPAAKAGIQPGDVILGYKTASGRLRKMRSAAALRRRIIGFGPGDDIKLSVRRGEKEFELTVKLPRTQR
jgi:serine protease Do